MRPYSKTAYPFTGGGVNPLRIFQPSSVIKTTCNLERRVDVGLAQCGVLGMYDIRVDSWSSLVQLQAPLVGGVTSVIKDKNIRSALDFRSHLIDVRETR
jgi:hypothetical protein